MKRRIERSDRAAHRHAGRRLARPAHHPDALQARAGAARRQPGDRGDEEGRRRDGAACSRPISPSRAAIPASSRRRPTWRAFLDELKADAERNGHKASVVFHGHPIVTVRPAAFKRCLANLVSNAARFAPSISITGHRDHRWLTVTVDDDGPGIPPHMREEVFKPFLRLDDARNQDEGGTGLGLAIARDIARSHGGDITLDGQPARRLARDGAGAGVARSRVDGLTQPAITPRPSPRRHRLRAAPPRAHAAGAGRESGRDRRAGRPSAGRARARGRAPPWCGRGPSSSSTQVRST